MSGSDPAYSPPVPEAADAEAWVEGEETLSLPVRAPGSDAAQEERRRLVSKPTSHRDDVTIPDYTLLKRIGAGAYGEVWLARSVTGALRAVKIVWREDFELTRTFHREFLGIQQFEPISRGHPGLVHILHVGWNEIRGFYYCVMELADDAVHGPHIDDIKSYVPRTLGTDMKQHGRLDLHFCQEAGIFLADALHYMHTHGLTHRDIKPSNIIFVGGVCKLADIGLVAGVGERSFVGTEGFVPPEGPGTPAADIYSLGKVIYEMSSGKDRMEFPEVPADLADEEWEFWMDLNRIICRSCAPDLKERFASADQFAEALRHVGEPRRESFSRRFSRAALILLFGSAFCGAALATYKYDRQWDYAMTVPVKPPPRPVTRPQPPTSGKPWQSRYGQWFSWSKDRHVADQPVDYTVYNIFLEATKRPAEMDFARLKTTAGKVLNVVLVPPADADAFSDWYTSIQRKSGHLDINHEIKWTPAKLPTLPALAPIHKDWSAIRCEVVRVAYGKVVIDSVPRGAEVFDGEELLGTTPLNLASTRAGEFDYEIRIPGYRAEHAKGTIKEGQLMSFNVRMRASGAVVFGKPWQNSLGMKWVPLGQAMMAATETRRKDFAAFLKDTKAPAVEGREVEKDPDLPVTFVSRAEALQFCAWLTQKERAQGLLEPDQEYRLPMDDEWSMAAYLPREKGDSPADRNLRVEGIYTWGFAWPPLPNQANLLDATAATPPAKGIAGYKDGSPGLAAVGRFRPDARGLSDLAGNVWEWVAEDWGGEDPKTQHQGVVRGGSYLTAERQELLASYRKRLPADSRLPDVGFRCVLAEFGVPARVEE